MMSNMANNNISIVNNTLISYPNSTMPTWFRGLMYCLLLSAFFIGSFGNALVCFTIYKRKRRRRIHLLTLNLAISDLIVLVVYLPVQTYWIYSRFKWELSSSLCPIITVINSGTVNASIGTLVAITRDRYVAVTKPIKTHRLNSTTEVKKYIVIIWLTSFVLTIPLLVVSKVIGGSCVEDWPDKKFEKMYWIFIFIIQFFLPLIFITFTYIFILIHLRRNSAFPGLMTSIQNNGGLNGELNGALKGDVSVRKSMKSLRRKRQQRKMLKTSVTLVAAYAVCVLPQHIAFFANVYGTLSRLKNSVYIFVLSNLLMTLNSTINPVIYGTLNDEMKRGFKNILVCRTYSVFFGNRRNGLQENSLTKGRESTALTTCTDSKSESLRKCSLQFELCPITRIDNL